jgi:DNA-binding Xre family transcriptional regulator
MMPNRVKDMDLTQIVANNLQRICKEHDLSSRELSIRADMPQKTVYNMVQGDHACRLSNLEKLCRTLLVSPTVMVTPHLGTNMLMSRRVPRVIEKFSKLSMADREKLEAIMDGMLGIEEKENNVE